MTQLLKSSEEFWSHFPNGWEIPKVLSLSDLEDLLPWGSFSSPLVISLPTSISSFTSGIYLFVLQKTSGISDLEVKNRFPLVI
jgi:hypothetical protein